MNVHRVSDKKVQLALLGFQNLGLCMVILVHAPATLVASASCEPRRFDFKEEAGGRTGGHNAQEIEFTRFKAQDGIQVERFVERYRSGDEAQVRLQSITDRASKVIKRGEEKHSEDNRIGEHVVLNGSQRGSRDL